ncbi:MAG: dipeptide ABC transporter ATP-binding protein [Lachnospiraceae bacterium]|nr:dipeptide ABC transporter ATP-binding protein [Lachnospiraceae bacterium]
MSEATIRVEHLKKFFPVKGKLFGPKQYVQAVNDVSFSIQKGQTLGIVGESGCGKSTLGRTILKIYEPDSGKIFFEGTDITALNQAQMHPWRKKMQMIFQDPYASLNPRFTVGEMIEEPMKIYQMYDKKERAERVQQLLALVGLKPDHIRRYPYEFSGGQRQRIGIARTLALDPEFIVCDEPFSALDVSIQAQIINLLEKIQDERQLTYIVVAHDLNAVRHISHAIGVMYLGHLVEIGPAEKIYREPLHPYTKALISSIPVADPDTAGMMNRVILEGEVPSPIHVPSGCPFSTRCKYCTEQCREKMPVLKEVDDRKVACTLYE